MARRVNNTTLRRTDRFRIVFEQGDKHKGALQRALSSQGLPPAFESKANVVAFQACDFLAWMHRNWLTTRTRRGRANYRPRQSLLQFTRMFPADSSVFGTWDGFARECEDQGIPKRT
jgi:sialic acid synthase SpsE